MSALLTPVVVGGKIPLRNRVGMAALTRNRCVDDLKPGLAHVKHYAQRARDGVGLIIGEGTFVDITGSDWTRAPMMVDDSHAEAWAAVTDAVHAEGGKMYFQAWHAGRAQHEGMPIMKMAGRPVLAPSAIPAKAGKYRDLPGSPGHTTNITVIEDPRSVVELYRHSTKLARKAGFDGVEILALGGYLPHEFLSSRANRRADTYGGSVENRCRFLLELVDVISDVFEGPERICVKIGPADVWNDSTVSFQEFQETYTYLIKKLVERKVGIITISRRGTGLNQSLGANARGDPYPLPPEYDPVIDFGPLVKFPGSPTMLMANFDYTVEEGEMFLRNGLVDMVSFGTPFMFNPDVIHRIAHKIPFSVNERGDHVYYGPYKTPDENYNDWPNADGVVP